MFSRAKEKEDFPGFFFLYYVNLTFQSYLEIGDVISQKGWDVPSKEDGQNY